MEMIGFALMFAAYCAYEAYRLHCIKEVAKMAAESEKNKD